MEQFIKVTRFNTKWVSHIFSVPGLPRSISFLHVCGGRVCFSGGILALATLNFFLTYSHLEKIFKKSTAIVPYWELYFGQLTVSGLPLFYFFLSAARHLISFNELFGGLGRKKRRKGSQNGKIQRRGSVLKKNFFGKKANFTPA